MKRCFIWEDASCDLPLTPARAANTRVVRRSKGKKGQGLLQANWDLFAPLTSLDERCLGRSETRPLLGGP